MSDTQHTHDEHDGPHEGPIKTPKQLIVTVLFAFLVPIIGIILLVTYVASDKRAGAGSDGLTEEAVLRRIQPVGTIELRDLSNPATLKSGEQVYTAQCAACHATGAAGAPKLGDAGAWAPRLPQGYQALLTSALKGKGAMGPQGGGDFTDLEIGRAVVYMANQSGGKLPEPQAAPAATAEAAQTEPTASDAGAAQQAAAAVAAANQAAAPSTAPAVAADANAGSALYNQACVACHAAGVAGAPKFGDKAQWSARLGQGLDALTASVIKGKGAMPPKGGSAASDVEIKAAVAYMVDAVK